MSYQVQVLCDGNGCEKSLDVPFSENPEKMNKWISFSNWSISENASNEHRCLDCTNDEVAKSGK